MDLKYLTETGSTEVFKKKNGKSLESKGYRNQLERVPLPPLEQSVHHHKP